MASMRAPGTLIYRGSITSAAKDSWPLVQGGYSLVLPPPVALEVALYLLL